MICATTSIASILYYYGRFPKPSVIEQDIRKIGETSVVDVKTVGSILNKYDLFPNVFQGKIFMPVPFILCNGKTWISIVPKCKLVKRNGSMTKAHYMEITDTSSEKATLLLTMGGAREFLMKGNYHGGFFVTKSP